MRACRTVFLLEPKSPFDDLYSLSMRFGDNEAEVEVVGPGFDASDLKRGDESPHELIRLARKSANGGYVEVGRSELSPAQYRAAWKRRLGKVGRMVAGRNAASAPCTIRRCGGGAESR